jgi:hypothetical protein
MGKAQNFVQPEPLPEPKPVRMPTMADPSLLEAAQRRREEILRRKGRMSTILSDNLRESTGSSGQKLGA